MLYVPEHALCLCGLKMSSLRYFPVKRLHSLFIVHSQLVAFSL